jgi:hypothetical protein
MGLLFSDDFNRSNRALDNGWVLNGAAWTIAANRCVGSATSPKCALQPVVGGSSNQTAQVTHIATGPTTYLRGLIVRASVTGADGYFALWASSTSPGAAYVDLYKRVAGVDTLLIRETRVPGLGVDTVMRLVALGGLIQVFLAGVLVISTLDSSIANGGYAGLMQSSAATTMDDFALYDTGPGALDCDVNYLEANTGAVELHLYTNYANWTPGTPGAPTFTADFGTISAQTVNDSENATLTYTPPTFACQDSIRDPLNGTSVTIGIGQAAGGDLAEVLRRLGEWDPLESVRTATDALTATSTVPASAPEPEDLFGDLLGASPGSSFGEYLYNIWTAIIDYPPSDRNLFAMLSYILVSSEAGRTASTAALLNLLQMRGENVQTLQDVIDTLRGPGSGTLSGIMDALGDLDFPDYTDALAAIKQDTEDTLTKATAIDTSLSAYRTITDITAQDILDAIGEVGGGDLTPVLEAIAAVRGEGNPDLAAVLDAIGDIPTDPITSLQVVLDAIASLVAPDNEGILGAIANILVVIDPELAAIVSLLELIPTNPITSLEPVLEAIEAVRGEGSPDLAAILTRLEQLPPRYPGADNVVWGTPVPLAEGVTINVPCDGVLVEVSNTPAGIGQYGFNGTPSWVHLGALAFFASDGELETAIPFSFPKHIIVPHTLLHPAGVVVRCKVSAAGTVTPWSLAT